MPGSDVKGKGERQSFFSLIPQSDSVQTRQTNVSTFDFGPFLEIIVRSLPTT